MILIFYSKMEEVISHIPKSIKELKNNIEECTRRNLIHYLSFPSLYPLADFIMEQMIKDHITDINLLAYIPSNCRLADHLIYDTELESILIGPPDESFQYVIKKILSSSPSFPMIQRLYNITINQEEFISLGSKYMTYKDINELLRPKIMKKSI